MKPRVLVILAGALWFSTFVTLAVGILVFPDIPIFRLLAAPDFLAAVFVTVLAVSQWTKNPPGA